MLGDYGRLETDRWATKYDQTANLSSLQRLHSTLSKYLACNSNAFEVPLVSSNSRSLCSSSASAFFRSFSSSCLWFRRQCLSSCSGSFERISSCR